jgi:ADP-L-glycero-D-manno-heptose 6-epimerase
MIVITGGGGFIGSVLAARLNEEGRSDIVIVDRFGTGDKWRNIAKRDFSEIVPVDGLFAWLDHFGDAVEAVFHLGAISSTTANDADAVIANNVNYSIALWRWCAAACKWLIYARLVGCDLWGRVCRVRRCGRHRSPQTSSPAQPLWLV